MSTSNPTVFQPTIEQRQLDKSARKLDSLELILPTTPLVESKKTDNVLNLTAGSYPSFSQKKPNTAITGNQSHVAGATCTSRLTVQNVRFTEQVKVGSTGNATFVNCKFDQQVVVESGGKACFTNCHLVINVNNAGGPANVAIMGCYREGAANINCTILWESTP